MRCIKGNPGAPGMGRGQAVLFNMQAVAQSSGRLCRTLEQAQQDCIAQVSKLYDEALDKLGEEHAKIFKAYKMLLSDQMLLKMLNKRIDAGEDPTAAIYAESRQIAEKFQQMKQEYLRQRGEDICYIGDMLIHSMRGENIDVMLPEGNSALVLVAHELSPADTFKLDKTRISAIVTEMGGTTSHTVILAKSMGIPAVTGAADICTQLKEREQVIVNGSTGEVFIEPDELVSQTYEKTKEKYDLLNAKINAASYQFAQTLDGVKIKLCANIGSPADMEVLSKECYDGIGLFRTEFLYSQQQKALSLEEECNIYRLVIEAAAPREVTIRTMDVGGDKEISFIKFPKEENPMCGNRGVRLCLERKDLFEKQLRAILIAGAEKKVKIMFPMITEIREFEECCEIVEKQKKQLSEEGISYCKQLKIGMMVETPSAAIMADSFAKRCDFLSIGTNDLTQYVTATDRGNPKVQGICNPYNPAVVRLIERTISAGNKYDKEVCVCGELAGNFQYLPLLIGFGIHTLSVSVPSLKKVRYLLCNTRYDQFRNFAKQILELDDGREIEHETNKLIVGLL
jgi:phosphoenolpyruvate-protein phosphotransferase (PTS system enzyme I)